LKSNRKGPLKSILVCSSGQYKGASGFREVAVLDTVTAELAGAVRRGGGGENDDNGDDETMNIVTMTTKKILQCPELFI